jgi:hypothetical protein
VVATHALDEISRDGALAGSFITEPDLARFVVLVTTQQRPLSRAARVILQAIRTIYGSDGAETLSSLARELQLARPSTGEEVRQRTVKPRT